METGSCVVSVRSGSGSFSEDDVPSGLIPCPQIGRLRRLMLTFDRTFVLVGTGRFVAFRLDHDVGLFPQIPVGITMQHVYCAARSVGLITIVGDREVPLPAFVARAKELAVTRCRACNVGDFVGNDPCWVCVAREEQKAVGAAFGSGRGARCRS